MGYHHHFTIFTAVFASIALSQTSNKLIHNIESPNTTKDWITYLKYALHKDLYIIRDSIVQHMLEVREPIRYMINWCEPSNSTAVWFDAHLQFWVPCGYGSINMNNHDKHNRMSCVQIKVNLMFYLDLRFLTFELGDSGKSCVHTSLKILKLNSANTQPSKWDTFAKFCGYREPWSVTVHFNEIALCISYINAYRLSSVSFKYISINRAFVLIHMLEPNTTFVKVAAFSKMQITHKGNKGNTAQKWTVKVDIGCVQQFVYLKLFGTIKYLKLFDGIKKWFPLMVIDHATNGTFVRESRQFYLNITTLYFESHVLLDNAIPDVNDSMSMSLTFQMLKVAVNHLTDTNMVRVKSQGKIFQLTLSLNPIDRKFSNIYFKIRQFQGFNWGGCNYGGYAIKQYVDHPILSPNLLGPFCSTTSPNQPFTSPHSLTGFSFGTHTTHLIMYSYSIMYAIDMDIGIATSDCEGILDPIHMWFSNASSYKTLDRKAIANNHTTITLDVVALNESETKNVITFSHLSYCIMLQSVSFATKKQIVYSVNFATRGTLWMYYFHPPTYLNSVYHQRSGSLSITFRRRHQAPQNMEFVRQTRLKAYDVSFVDFTHYSGAAYHYISYVTKLFPLPIETCIENDIIDSEFHYNFSTNRFYAFTYDNCGLVFIQEKVNDVTYSFVLNSVLPLNYASTPMWYITIFKIDCGAVYNRKERYDILTTRMTVDKFHTTANSVDLINNDYHLQTHHAIISLVYTKRQSCKKVFILYRDVSVNLIAVYLSINIAEKATIQVSIN